MRCTHSGAPASAAVMSLLDRAAWWLPPAVDRALPHVSIEGEEYFAERDAEERRREKAIA